MCLDEVRLIGSTHYSMRVCVCYNKSSSLCLKYTYALSSDSILHIPMFTPLIPCEWGSHVSPTCIFPPLPPPSSPHHHHHLPPTTTTIFPFIPINFQSVRWYYTLSGTANFKTMCLHYGHLPSRVQFTGSLKRGGGGGGSR